MKPEKIIEEFLEELIDVAAQGKADFPSRLALDLIEKLQSYGFEIVSSETAENAYAYEALQNQYMP